MQDLGITLKNLINNQSSRQDWDEFMPIGEAFKPIPWKIKRHIKNARDKKTLKLLYENALDPSVDKDSSIDELYMDIISKLPIKLKVLADVSYVPNLEPKQLCQWFWHTFLHQLLLDKIKYNTTDGRSIKTKVVNIDDEVNKKGVDIKDESKSYSESIDEQVRKKLNELKSQNKFKWIEYLELNIFEGMSYAEIAQIHPKVGQNASERAINIKQQVSDGKPKLAPHFEEIKKEKIDEDSFEKEFDYVPKFIPQPKDEGLMFYVQESRSESSVPFGRRVRDILQSQYNESKELAKVVDPKYIKKYEDLLLKLISNDNN